MSTTFTLVDRNPVAPRPAVSGISKLDAVARVAEYRPDERPAITVSECAGGDPVAQWNGVQFIAANVLDLVERDGFLAIPEPDHNMLTGEDYTICDINGTPGADRDEEKVPWPIPGDGAVLAEYVARAANCLHGLFIDGWISQEVYFFRVPDGRIWNFAQPSDLGLDEDDDHDAADDEDAHLDMHTEPDLRRAADPAPSVPARFDIASEARERASKWGVPHLEQVLAIAMQCAFDAGVMRGIELRPK